MPRIISKTEQVLRVYKITGFVERKVMENYKLRKLCCENWICIKYNNSVIIMLVLLFYYFKLKVKK